MFSLVLFLPARGVSKIRHQGCAVLYGGLKPCHQRGSAQQTNADVATPLAKSALLVLFVLSACRSTTKTVRKGGNVQLLTNEERDWKSRRYYILARSGQTVQGEMLVSQQSQHCPPLLGEARPGVVRFDYACRTRISHGTEHACQLFDCSSALRQGQAPRGSRRVAWVEKGELNHGNCSAPWCDNHSWKPSLRRCVPLCDISVVKQTILHPGKGLAKSNIWLLRRIHNACECHLLPVNIKLFES